MKKFPVIFSCVLILATSLSLSAETHLSDEIGGRIFSPSGNPYIVDQDVVVPKNEQIVIKAGCIFLFNSFSGINVFGSMLVEGTEENPVVFSSINDSQYNPDASQLPNAFDWNGIYLAEGSGDVKFRNFRLMYSVFGIKSKKDDITLQNGYFKQNGQFHFTINDNIHYVQDNISYSYNVGGKTEPGKEEPKEKKPAVKTKTEKKEGVGKGRKVAAFSLMGVSLVCGTTGIITGVKAGQYFGKSESAETPEDFAKYKDKLDPARATSITTGVVCGVTLPLSLFLLIKKDKSTMTKKVSLNITGGKKTVDIGINGCF
jgi:hypothetical protein